MITRMQWVRSAAPAGGSKGFRERSGRESDGLIIREYGVWSIEAFTKAMADITLGLPPQRLCMSVLRCCACYFNALLNVTSHKY
jgi:hypothetical protein